MNAVTRAAFDAKAAFNALIPVNDRQAAVFIFLHGYSLCRTVFCAQAAADTRDTAVGHGCLAFGTVIAFNMYFNIGIAQIKNLLRALGNTDPTAGTFSVVKNWQTAAAHGNCMEGTALDAGAETKTTEVAFAWAALSFGSQMTICYAFVLIGFGSVDLTTVTGKTTNFAQIFA